MINYYYGLSTLCDIVNKLLKYSNALDNLIPLRSYKKWMLFVDTLTKKVDTFWIL